MTFKEFNLHAQLLEGLDAMGFDKATPIQEQAIPEIMAGNDLIACAQTGTGKTAAFILPVLDKLLTSPPGDGVNTLILAPTRELAIQIDQQIEGLAYFTGASSIAIYGGGDGMAWEQQKRALVSGANIITATPGRLIALLTSGELKFPSLKHLILDEADRMLDMGFYEDIILIITELSKERQSLLFSATMPPKIRQLANRILKNPKEISLAVSKPAEKIIQKAYVVNGKDKDSLTGHILKEKKYQSVVIFSATKENVKVLDRTLRKSGFNCKAFSSDLEQAEREDILRDFKSKRLNILVATDILSRGIDVEGIDLVINYDSPSDPEDYVHRIGRTARAEAEGTAVTLISEKDIEKFMRIEKFLGNPVQKYPLPEGLGPGPDYVIKFRDTRRKPPFKRTKRRH